MISLKEFVTTIHQAVSAAADTLMDKNREQLTKYFDKIDVPNAGTDDVEQHLKPKMVRFDVPNLDSQDRNEQEGIMVPLITLVPFTASQIEKVTLTTEFRLSVDENNELQLDFSKHRNWGKSSPLGKLEIVVSPTDTTEGLQQLIEGYEAMLKKQL